MNDNNSKIIENCKLIDRLAKENKKLAKKNKNTINKFENWIDVRNSDLEQSIIWCSDCWMLARRNKSYPDKFWIAEYEYEFMNGIMYDETTWEEIEVIDKYPTLNLIQYLITSL